MLSNTYISDRRPQNVSADITKPWITEASNLAATKRISCFYNVYELPEEQQTIKDYFLSPKSSQSASLSSH